MQATEGAAVTRERTPAAAVPDHEAARLQRTLKLVVVGLGVLIIAGLAAVAGRVIYLARSPETAETTQVAAPALAVRPEQTLDLPAGAVVRSVSLAGNRLVVHYEAGGAQGIAIIDLQTGRLVTNVKVAPAP